MNRLIAITIILTAFATQLQAQQPTPARRTQANNVQKQSGQAASAARRPAQTQSEVKTAVASKPKQNAPIGTSVQKSNSKVVKASAMQEEVIYDEHIAPMAQGSVVYEGMPSSGCASCNSGSCDGGCGVATFAPGIRGFSICNPPPGARQLCICLPSHGWAQLDYLNWYPSGMDIPTLVTGTSPGYFSTNSSLIEDSILKDAMNGGRMRFGWWFANNPNLGIELEYFRTETNTFAFSGDLLNNAFLGRPFYDMQRATNINLGENASHVDSVSVNASSRLQGGGVKLRKLLCCGDECKQSWVFCRPVATQSRVDATLGWRTLELNEALSINTRDSDSVVTANAVDSFDTQNIFNGGELGFMWQGRRGYWTLDVLLRTAFGNTSSDVTIDGSTEFVRGTTRVTREGGLLALPSNIDTYSSNQFSVVPEIGATLGYQLTDRTRLTVGYTMIYWTNVARPGDQIDVDVNPTYIPTDLGPGTQTGIVRPGLPQIELTNYFIQGFNVGGEYRW